MRNVKWMSAGLGAGLLFSGLSFADGAPQPTTPASAAAQAHASGLRPPTQKDAAAAQYGVQVAVLRQSCSQMVETDLPGNDLVEIILEVEVRNGTSVPIGVHRDGFQLRAPDGSAIRTSTWFATNPGSVDPGQAQTFELRFMSRGGLSCSKEIVLESSSAVVKERTD
jgi:hypothetical protein